jgi:DNA-binding LytR/AlgR family response regulator
MGSVGASPTDPITWAATRNTLLISGLVGVFLSFVGAFGTDGLSFLIRTPFMVALSWTGAVLGMLSFRLVIRLPWVRGRNRYLQAAASAALMTAPMGLVVWGATQLIPHGGAPVTALPNYVLISFVMCEAMTLFVVFMQTRAAQIHAVPAAPPKFLERLPLKLRGAEVWAVEAEDHYLRLHTSKGQDLILLRLADAVDELAGIEGAQVHRSWWVARDAIADARRGDGRATLTLKDGSEVPVSRTYAKIIREKGWI